jgi:glycosyltransferase involved in cell wall biosynthesis
MNLLFYSRAYANVAGGVEKMSLDLARGLVERGHTITILSLDQKMDKSFFQWPEKVSWIKLGIGDPNKKNNILIRLKRVRAIRNVVKADSFDAAVGFQIGSFALLKSALFGLKIRTIAAERNAPTLFKYIANGKLKRFFSNIILYTADCVTVQFEDYKKLYPKFLQKKIKVTPNWVASQANIKRKLDSKLIIILFIGRLTYQKNVSVLIKAFRYLPNNFKLKIVGDGPELEVLKQLDSDLSQRIEFSPPSNDLSVLYSSANVFCLPSRWEGFPNVIAEALSHGVPCVGFSECSGIPQLVFDGDNGFTAKKMSDPQSLAEALISASLIKSRPSEIALTIRNYTYDKYIKSWEIAFCQ